MRNALADIFWMRNEGVEILDSFLKRYSLLQLKTTDYYQLRWRINEKSTNLQKALN